MRNDVVFTVLALLAVVSVVSFGAGYWVAGGIEKFSQRYTIGENIVVYVRAPDAENYVEVGLNSGMTVLDAAANIMPLITEVYSYGPAVKTIDNQWLLYTVNGESPSVGMDKYQLSGGENIELSVWA